MQLVEPRGADVGCLTEEVNFLRTLCEMVIPLFAKLKRQPVVIFPVKTLPKPAPGLRTQLCFNQEMLT